MPKITIITPILNSSKTLTRALDSICSQSADIEHIVLDAGSTDGSVELLKSYLKRYNLKLIHVPDLPLYPSIELGFQQCKGEINCWLNADDYYLPGALAAVAKTFSEHPNLNWLTGIPSWHYEANNAFKICPYVPIYSRHFIRLGLHRRNGLGFLQQESMFWRNSLYKRTGGAKVLRRYRLAADFHLWRAFAKQTALRTIDKVLACFSISEGQLSQRRRSQYDKECGGIRLPFLARPFGRLINQVYSLFFSDSCISYLK